MLGKNNAGGPEGPNSVIKLLTGCAVKSSLLSSSSLSTTSADPTHPFFSPSILYFDIWREEEGGKLSRRNSEIGGERFVILYIYIYVCMCVRVRV